MNKSVGNIDRHGSGRGPRRTSLVSKPGFTHHSQPQGKSIGIGGSKKGGYARSEHQSEILGQHRK